MVVLRSPIHANEPSEYNGMLYRTSNRVLNNGIKVIILICMDGTSQYHHYREYPLRYAGTDRIKKSHFLIVRLIWKRYGLYLVEEPVNGEAKGRTVLRGLLDKQLLQEAESNHRCGDRSYARGHSNFFLRG